MLDPTKYGPSCSHSEPSMAFLHKARSEASKASVPSRVGSVQRPIASPNCFSGRALCRSVGKGLALPPLTIGRKQKSENSEIRNFETEHTSTS